MNASLAFVLVWQTDHLADAQVQEPAAALFCVLNFCAHARGMQRLLRGRHDWSVALAGYAVLGTISCNAWIWACVFHSRDKPLTEAVDYHSATAVQVAGVGVALTRVLGLNRLAAIALTMVLLVGYGHHVFWLSNTTPFDYGYNMQCNLVLALTAAAMWLGWLGWPTATKGQARAGSRTLLCFLGLMAGAISLEIYGRLLCKRPPHRINTPVHKRTYVLALCDCPL